MEKGKSGAAPEVTMKELGTQLEKRVMKILEREGKANVRRSVIIRDKNKNISEIDVVCGRLRKTYVECKNYTHPIDLDKVAKFKEVLLLNRINPKRGLFVTTSTYTPRATTIGIKCIDGSQLDAWEKHVNKTWKRHRVLKGTLGVVTLVGALVLACPDDIYRQAGFPPSAYQWRSRCLTWGKQQCVAGKQRFGEWRDEHYSTFEWVNRICRDGKETTKAAFGDLKTKLSELTRRK